VEGGLYTTGFEGAGSTNASAGFTNRGTNTFAYTEKDDVMPEIK